MADLTSGQVGAANTTSTSMSDFLQPEWALIILFVCLVYYIMR